MKRRRKVEGGEGEGRQILNTHSFHDTQEGRRPTRRSLGTLDAPPPAGGTPSGGGGGGGGIC